MKAPKITALVLAAGHARRMKGTHKLQAMAEDKSIIRHTVENILHSSVDDVLVITGYDNKHLEACLQGLPVSFLYNPDHASGMASSLTRGIAALDASVDAALICLGDMPRVTSKAIDRIMMSFGTDNAHAICVPTYNGVQGNPILWARHYFPEIQKLTGDRGAKTLVSEHANCVVNIDMPDEPGILFDIDTPTDLNIFSQGLK